MEQTPEVKRVIGAIATSNFTAALQVIENAKRPNSLVSTCTLIYFDEIGVQLRAIAEMLQAIRRDMLIRQTPTP
jgi:hypothetical protein